jgi:sortase A
MPTDLTVVVMMKAGSRAGKDRQCPMVSDKEEDFMSRRKLIIIILIGIALVAVPFIFKAIDKNKADKYIREFEVNDETDEGQEDQGEASGDQTETSEEIAGGAIGIIEIESLGITYPIFEGTGDAQLNNGIGHMTDTAALCEKGNAVLAGHNGSRRGVFFTNLNKISIGATVRVTNKEKVTHTYEVYETGIYGPYDETVYAESEEECLTLFTCAYSGTRRFVVKCRLAETDEA